MRKKVWIMRSNEERIAAMHMRASEIRNEQVKRRNSIIGYASVLVCFISVIGMGLVLPGLLTQTVPGDLDGMNASIFSDNGALGYIVIGILAFMLGAAVTVFCIRLRRLSESEKPYDTESGE